MTHRPVRLGAVSYLNVRPLVYGLSARSDQMTLRFDVPSECARLLAVNDIDLGMIPSIAYGTAAANRIVPGVAIGSDGAVASVALFSRMPLADVRRIALDTSSRTSANLVKVLCARQFGISPTFVPCAPDLDAMLATADAALLIGDPALFVDYRARGADKTDLGLAWATLTGLPFVWAFWAGRPDAVDADTVGLLQSAAYAGMTRLDTIAADYCATAPARIPVAARYLHEHLSFQLDARALDGLGTYYRESAALGLIPAVPDVMFYAVPDAAPPSR